MKICVISKTRNAIFGRFECICRKETAKYVSAESRKYKGNIEGLFLIFFLFS